MENCIRVLLTFIKNFDTFMHSEIKGQAKELNKEHFKFYDIFSSMYTQKVKFMSDYAKKGLDREQRK